MAIAMAMVARAMVTVMRVLGERQQGQWQRRRLWRATIRGIAMAMRVASDEECEGSKAMKTVTRVADEQQ
jgi:hypothetical protein